MYLIKPLPLGYIDVTDIPEIMWNYQVIAV